MGIETLIERLRTESLYADKASLEIMDLCMDAAAAIATLQAENEKLRAELENYRKGHCSEGGCAAEKDRDAVLAELEKVKEKYDAAIEYLREIEWCAGCKHFGGLDGCKKWAMGQCTEKHDLYEFIGPQKED